MSHIAAARLALIFLLAIFFTWPAAHDMEAARAVDDPGGAPPTAEPGPALTPAVFPAVATPDPVVAWMIGQVETETIRQYTGDLSGEWPVTVRGSTVKITSRNTNSGTPIQNATNYAGDHFDAAGLDVEYHRWGPSTAPNVIGQKTGTTAAGNIYLAGAHLDDMPTGPTAPGADDNASGSVAILVAADILSQFDWKCTLRFALWTGEEQGLLGSDKYAQRASSNGENIIGSLNLDMIGWNTAGSLPEMDLHAKSSMPATVDLANQMASVIEQYELALVPEVRADGTGSSDHASFWKYGYNAILGIEDYYPNDHDFNPYYHTTADQLEQLDMGYDTEFVKAVVAEMAHMPACLVTGTLQGRVTGAGGGTPVADAEIRITDTAGRTYILETDATGSYSQKVPPETYGAVAAAYGYEEANAAGLAVAADASLTADISLNALAPSAPSATASLDAGEVKLSWMHVSPNTAYAVRRSTEPYFSPASGEAVATVPAAHPPAPSETLSWRDAGSGAGDTSTNHFYLVMGQNAEGVEAAANLTGEFDFALLKP